MAGNAEVAKAYVTIIPSMRGAQDEISSELIPAARKAGDKAGKAAGEDAGDSFGGGISAKTGAIAGAVGVLASKALDAIAQLGGEMIETSDATDKFRSTLEFAGLDTGEIDRVAASTRKYADETVYDLSTIQNATAQLAANGVKNYDKLVEASGNLNAIAGGNADTFKSVAMVLTQTAGAGKLTTENWNQLSEAIPGAAGVLMDAMKDAGAYTGNFRDAMAEGEITADEFNDALLSIGFDDVAVEAATSTDTIEGAMGNLEATVVGIGSDIITALKPVATDIISSVSDGLSGAADAVGAFVSQAGAELQSFASSDTGQSIASSLASVADAFAKAGGDAAQAFGRAFGDIGIDTGAMSSVFDGMATRAAQIASDISAGIGDALAGIDWNGIATAARGIFDAWSSVAGAVAQAYAQFVAIDVKVSTSIIGQIFSTVASTVSQLASVLSTSLAPVIERVLPIAQAALSGIWVVAGQILSAVGAFVTAVMPGLQAGIDGIIAGLSPILSGIASIASTVIDILWPILQQVADWWNSDFYPALQDAMTTLGAVFGDVFASLGAYLQQFGAAFGDMMSFVNGIIAALKPFIEPILSGIVSSWQGTFSTMLDVVKNIISNVGAVISTIYNTAASVIGRVRNIFSSVFGGIAKIVQQVISGDIGGAINTLKSTVSNVLNNVKGIFGDIFGGIKSVVGNAVNAISEGIRGIATGITAPFRSAISAIRSLWNSTIGGFSFTVPDWVPGIGGGGIRIPYLASGGTITAAGTVLVGEQGPELLTLPTGARVTPLRPDEVGGGDDVMDAIRWLASVLPGIIEESTPDGITGRDFGRLVRRYA